MADLKDYLVRVDYNQWNDIYIVSAKNAKEAIDVVYETQFADRKESDKAKGFVPIAKKDLHARSLGSLHNEEGRVVWVH